MKSTLIGFEYATNFIENSTKRRINARMFLIMSSLCSKDQNFTPFQLDTSTRYPDNGQTDKKVIS